MNMEQVSADQIEITRTDGARIESEILRRLADVTQAHAAACMGLSASTVNRMVEDIGRFAHLLAALRMQVVATNSMVVPKEDLTALERFAYNYLKIKLSQEGVL